METPVNLTIHRDDADFFKGLPDYESWSKSVLRDMGTLSSGYCGGVTRYQITRGLLNDLDHPTLESKYRQCVMEVYARKRNITTQWGEIQRLRLDAEVARVRGAQAVAKLPTITDPFERRLAELEADRFNLEAQKCEIGIADIQEMVLTQIREGAMYVEKAKELAASGAMTDQVAYIVDLKYEDEKSSKRIETEQRMVVEQEVKRGLAVVEAKQVFDNIMAERAPQKPAKRGVIRP